MVDKMLAIILLVVLSIDSSAINDSVNPENIIPTSIEVQQETLLEELPINEFQTNMINIKPNNDYEVLNVSFMETEREKQIKFASNEIRNSEIESKIEPIVDQKQLAKDNIILEYKSKYVDLSEREQLVLSYLIPLSLKYADEYKIRPSVLVAQAIGEGGWINWNAYYEIWELGKDPSEVITEGWASGFGQKGGNGYITISDGETIKKYCKNITGKLYVTAATKISNYDEYLDELLAIYNPYYKEEYTKKIKLIIDIYDLKKLDSLYEF